MAEEKKEKKGFFRRFGKLILILSGSIITFVIVAAVTVVLLLSDKTRFSGKIGSDDTIEVIKKNYIEGFKDTEKTGKFTFQIPEEDINSVLNKASKSINNDYVEQIYYGRGKKNHHFFYIDLNLPIITSRVVIDTVASEGKDLTIKLAIEKISLGKINAYNFIKDKGILTSSLFDGFFKSSNIPITFNEKNNTFTVKPLGFIDNFPKTSTISTTYFRLAKEIGSPVIKIEPSMLGFTLDFSKFRSSNSISVTDYSGQDIPNFTTLVKSEFDSIVLDDMNPSNTYTITKEDINLTLSKSILSSMKEEVASTLTKKKVVNKLENVKILNQDDEVNANLYLVYSFNGYLVDAVVPLEFIDMSEAVRFSAYYSVNYDVKVGKYNLEDFAAGHGTFFVENARAVLGTCASSSEFFNYDVGDDSFGLLFNDFTGSDSSVKLANKEVRITPSGFELCATKI